MQIYYYWLFIYSTDYRLQHANYDYWLWKSEREEERNTLPKEMFQLEVQGSPSPCTDWWCWIFFDKYALHDRMLKVDTFGRRTFHKLPSFLDICTWSPDCTQAVEFSRHLHLRSKSMIGSPFLPLWAPATDSNVTWLEVARMILRHFADDKKHKSVHWGSILALDPWLETDFFVSRLTFLKVCQLHTCTKATWVAHDHSIGIPMRHWRSCAWSLPSYSNISRGLCMR